MLITHLPDVTVLAYIPTDVGGGGGCYLKHGDLS